MVEAQWKKCKKGNKKQLSKPFLQKEWSFQNCVRAECSFEFHHPAIKTTQTNDRPTEEEMPPKKKTGTAHVSEEKSARFATRFYDAFFAPSRLKRKIVVIPRRWI